MLNEQIIKTFLEDIDITIMSSISLDGYPVSRALLAPRKIEGINVFYFSTNTSSNKIAEYMSNPKASLYFFNKNKFEGLLIMGEMEIINDMETKKMIWREGDELYYPKGLEDDDYIVLRFRAEKFRLYKNFKTENFIIN